MANEHFVVMGDIGWAAQPLTAGVADNVIFPQEVQEVEVLTDGVAVLYVCTTGDDAVAPSGPGSTKVRTLPAGSVSSLVMPVDGRKVSLISPGTPTYSVTVA